jgi:hypothetical protein
VEVSLLEVKRSLLGMEELLFEMKGSFHGINLSFLGIKASQHVLRTILRSELAIINTVNNYISA